MSNTINIDLDLKNNMYSTITVQQNDDVVIEAELYDNGIPVDLSNYTVIANFTAANDTFINIAGSKITKNNNKTTIVCEKYFSKSIGFATGQITLVDTTSKQASTFPLKIKVNKGIINNPTACNNASVILQEIVAANVVGNKIIENIADSARTYPSTSKLYKDVQEHSTQINKKADVADLNNFKQNAVTKEELAQVIAQAGNDNTEIVDARGGETTLGIRLDKLEKNMNVNSVNLFEDSEFENVIINDNNVNDSFMSWNVGFPTGTLVKKREVPATYGDNIMDDGSFETTLVGWNKSSDSIVLAINENGITDNCLRMDKAGYIYKSYSGLTIGKNYELEGYFKCIGSTNVRVLVKEGYSVSNDNISYFNFTNSKEWTKFTLTFKTTATSITILIQLQEENGSAYWDEFKLREVLTPKQSNQLVVSNSSAITGYVDYPLYFWNIENISVGSSISISTKIYCSTADKVRLKAYFFDNSYEDRTTGIINDQIYYSIYNSSGESVLKLENMVVPYSAKGCFGIYISIEINGGTEVKIYEPMASISPICSIYTKSVEEFKGKELVKTANKIISKSKIVTSHMGDSITHGGDYYTLNKDKSYSSLVAKWIEKNLNISVEKRNNSCDGSQEIGEMVMFKRGTLDTNASIVTIAGGRNNYDFTVNEGITLAKRYSMVEAMIRKAIESNVDVLLFFTSYENFDKVDTLDYPTKPENNAYTIAPFDVQQQEQYKNLAEYYGVGYIDTLSKARKMVDKGLIEWGNWFNGSPFSKELVHPGLIWRIYIADLIRKYIIGSVKEQQKETNKYVVPSLPSSNLAESKYNSFVSYFPKDSSITKTGTWEELPNTDPFTFNLHDTTFGDIAISGGGTALGNWDRPITATGNSNTLTFSFTGTTLCVWLMGFSFTGNCTITIDGESFVVNTARAMPNVSYPTFFKEGLSNSAHTVTVGPSEENDKVIFIAAMGM